MGNYILSPSAQIFRLFLFFGVMLISSVRLTDRLAARAESSPDFEKEIKPLLEKNCFSCHSAQTRSSGLALETVQSIFKGGDLNGPSVLPGKSRESPLVLYLRGEKQPRMPKEKPPLPEDQITLIVKWIDQIQPSVPAESGSEAREYGWPWTRLGRVEVPQVMQKEWVKNPIDAFVLAKLEEKNIQPAPPASRRALIRRLYFDLIGLSPAPEEVERFVNDPSPDAYEKEIEKLLGDPRYGERWGRHWLDVVRYADTRGGGSDFPLPHMWRYRDYVIGAFNQDRAYDRFIREQIAGDAYSAYGSEGKIALGFLNLGVQVEGDSDEEGRRDILIDAVDTTGSVFLGMTLACARCHDHKYDPIPQRDYYRLEAFFAPMTVGPTPVSFTQYEFPYLYPELWERRARSWKELLSGRKEWGEKTTLELKQRLEKGRLLEAPQDFKDRAVPVSDADLKKAMEEGLFFNREERDLYRLIVRQNNQSGNAIHPDRYEPLAYSARVSFTRATPLFPTTYVLKGGNYKLRGEAVEPGFLSAVTGNSDPVNLEGVNTFSSVGGPRKLLAEWIASPENPLTARVMVNRIWQHHFGEGLVLTPNDFGKNGGGTVHRELIDWLAGCFIESGWSVKAMHRLMLQSNVYRQSMRNPLYAEYEKIDAENRYLWRRSPIRLEAEVIRDAILAASGQLNSAMGGPPFYPEADDELLKQTGTWWEPSPREERNRRTIYMLQSRWFQLPLIRVFDGPNLSESCAARKVTMVTPQVFTLFNSRLVHEQSREMANRILCEVGSEPEAQVERAFKLAFQRAPSGSERAWSLAFLRGLEVNKEKGNLASDQTEPTGSLADLCLVLLNTNELIFLE